MAPKTLAAPAGAPRMSPRLPSLFHCEQKDPGEYLLELQRFAAIPDVHLRRHAIDMHLR